MVTLATECSMVEALPISEGVMKKTNEDVVIGNADRVVNYLRDSAANRRDRSFSRVPCQDRLQRNLDRAAFK
jgi:hypothetical protein